MPRPTNPSELSLPDSFALACRMSGPLELRAVHRATRAEQTHTLTHPFALIGRAPSAGVRLDDPSVSQCHAYLQVVEGLPYCIDLGSRTGVVWDDGTQSRGWVRPGHVLRVGAFDVRVGRPGSADDPHAAAADEPLDRDGHHALAPAALEVHAPGAAAASHPLDRPISLIGRHPGCDLRFVDDALAYFHCALVNTPDGVWCVDVLGRRGVLLNGRWARLARVRDGDLIEFGKVSVVLREDVPGGRPPGGELVFNGPAARGSGNQALASLPEALAQSVAGAFAPVREMMEQFQQCFVAMARMFTSMQQEHASMMCEQMRQLQELTRELREMRADAGRAPAPPQAAAPSEPPTSQAPPAPAAQPPKLPTPSVPAADTPASSDAHTWFLDRLAKLGHPPSGAVPG